MSTVMGYLDKFTAGQTLTEVEDEFRRIYPNRTLIRVDRLPKDRRQGFEQGFRLHYRRPV